MEFYTLPYLTQFVSMVCLFIALFIYSFVSHLDMESDFKPFKLKLFLKFFYFRTFIYLENMEFLFYLS